MTSLIQSYLEQNRDGLNDKANHNISKWPVRSNTSEVRAPLEPSDSNHKGQPNLFRLPSFPRACNLVLVASYLNVALAVKRNNAYAPRLQTSVPFPNSGRGYSIVNGFR